MKIKKIKKIKINSFEFKVIWDKKFTGAHLDYHTLELTISTDEKTEDIIFMYICHEVMELCAIEMNVRFPRPDAKGDYIFVYDHRQHETMMNMFASIVSQFIE